MSDLYGAIRVVIRQDGKTLLDDTVPNPEARLRTVGKGFVVEHYGAKSSVDVEFHFDPPLTPASLTRQPSEEDA